MKKWICMLCALSLVFTLAAPAFAAQRPSKAAQAFTLNAEALAASALRVEYTHKPAADSWLYYDQLNPVAQDIYNGLAEHAEEMIDGKSKVRFPFHSEMTAQELAKQLAIALSAVTSGLNAEDYIHTSLRLEDVTLEDYADAISAFSRDHVEVFWIDFSRVGLSVTEETVGDEVRVFGELAPLDKDYWIEPYKSSSDVYSDRQAMNGGITAALSKVDRTSSPYAQLRTIHDWLCEQNVYDTDLSVDDYRRFEAVSALDTNPYTMPVCEGYARAFKLLCDTLSIPCMLVDGIGYAGGTSELHMWDIVRLDGAWYAVDVTWDDTRSDYGYFLVGSSTFVGSKTFSESHVFEPLINFDGRMFYTQTLSAKAYEPAETTAPTVELGEPLPGFTASNVYTDGMFSDVKAKDWFRTNVAQAYALGLMVGNGDGTFNANGSVTIAETISIAARLHAAYTGASIPKADGAWYMGAVRYAQENGIITRTYTNYNAPIKRGEFASILSRALPADVLQPINEIALGTIPDVASGDEIYMLYRAGVLRGDTDGTFHPDAAIRRCEVAAIVTRMAVPSLRVEFTL
ncbi:MAG: S-layer homology domain-containing protein [Oscillospiraceae bacterium]|nr:S-layer homology domain-containing protein [Oscillospiraceae bacterium]